MKEQILAVTSVVVLAFFATGCEKSEAVRAQEESLRAQQLRAITKNVIDTILYIKDDRTGLCFAYHVHGVNNIRESIATVPCEAIPPKLLTVAK